MLTKSKDTHILFDGAAAEVRDNIWISLLKCNGLIMIDIDTGVTKFVNCFENENSGYQLHSRIVSYQNKLFFIPMNAKNIAIYDLTKKEFRYLPVHNFGKSGRFAAALTNEKYMYMVSFDFVQVVKMDMDLEKIVDKYELEYDYYNYNIPPIKLKDGIYKISGSAKRENSSWKFDFEKSNLSLCEHTFANDADLIAGCIGKSCIWIIGDNNMLYRLSEKCECIEQYDISKIVYQIVKDTKVESLKCICFDSVLIIIFYDKCCILKIPLVGNVLNIEKYEYIKFESAFFPDNYNDLIIILNDSIVIINNGGERKVSFNIDTQFLKDMMDKSGGVLNEMGVYGVNLNRYIESIYEIKGNSLLSFNNVNMPRGKVIYDKV